MRPAARPAALPLGTGQCRADGLDQAAVGIAGDQRDSGQAACCQVAKNASQPAPSSALVTCRPRISL